MNREKSSGPLVSVVIAAYNAAEFISETLDSILAQTYKNIEVIVVDDGSTDNTAEIVKSYYPRVYYSYQNNSGSCASPRNTGLAQAKGEFINFFDADDIMLPKKIETQILSLTANPGAVMSVTNYRNFSGNERSKEHFSTCPTFFSFVIQEHGESFSLHSETFREIIIEENFTIASSPIFRTQCVINENGFDEALTACEDFHLIYRIAMHGEVIVNPQLGFERRVHANNMSSNNERMLQNLIISRQSLSLLEPNVSLGKRLEKRKVGYMRNLQAFLINKGIFKPALRIYKETFPPKSLSELNHDLRQGVKIIIKQFMPRKTPEN